MMDGNDDFKHFFQSAFADMDKLFKEMDSTLHHFVFGGFSTMDSTPESFYDQNPSEDVQPKKSEDSRTIRDHYLKKGDSNESNAQIMLPPPIHSRSFFERFFELPKEFHHPKVDIHPPIDRNKTFDEDLDDKIINNKRDEFIQPYQPKSMPIQHSHSQSVSVRRIQRPDGTIEEVRTVRDSNGKEEKVVTRIIGDRTHRVINRKDLQKGEEETEEVFENFDEKNLNEFNNDWSKNVNSSRFSIFNPFSRHRVDGPNDQQLPQLPPATPQNPPQQDQQQPTKSLVSKIFSWFK